MKQQSAVRVLSTDGTSRFVKTTAAVRAKLAGLRGKGSGLSRTPTSHEWRELGFVLAATCTLVVTAAALGFAALGVL